MMLVIKCPQAVAKHLHQLISGYYSFFALPQQHFCVVRAAHAAI
jgi:hypothetical protein